MSRDDARLHPPSPMAAAAAAAAVLILASLLAGGCASAVSAGSSAVLSADDLVQMTDKMATSIAGNPHVQRALAENGRLKFVVQPVENYMTAEVLPRGAAEAYTARVRALLASHAPDKFTWVMNRDSYYRLKRQELENVDLGPTPESIQPDYALVARFDSLAYEDRKTRSSSYLCVYELTNLHTRDILWTDKYEVKKTAVKGFLD